ncbi:MULTISPECIES: methyltransferase [Actinomadura]|uniref:Dimerisation domain-containing protein n=1 Tax=Actinomadura madurae TaxID=1993 RepID=A0A1I5P5A6_9ACTN|nr:methyltransferase [Actinomadura madurae]SFP29272.1 Dimerisation domain-containing protein [Actinomadura madurae]SPT63801.1 Multifunctional cyclase-dehydratase-3-O-methyl transferase tcmN [Actinomadura madurae]
MTEHAVRMRALLHGQIVSRALCVVAELGLADELRDGPRTAEELAARVSAHPGAVRRLLRALSAFDVFAADADGAFRLTPLGATLCEDAPGSARPTALLLGGPVGTAWTRLGHTARTGGSAFTDAFGTGFFEHLTGEPELNATFDRSQAEGLRVELDEVFGAVDFTPYRRIVDVGGGDGELLARLLEGVPGAHGRLLDLPGTVARAAGRLAARGLAGRCSLVAGDFFAEVPSGGDLYLLSHVLHDWDDERAVDILRVCRTAMPPDATLMVIDLLPDGGTDDSSRFAAGMDLYLMSLFGGDGGGERGDEAVRRLLRDAGLEPRSTLRLPSGMGVVTAGRP